MAPAEETPEAAPVAQEVAPAVEDTPVQQTSAYAMSKSQLMLAIPSDWTIYQQDGGSASVIVIESLDEQTWMYVGVERAQTFEGEKIVYADWLSGKVGLSASGVTALVDGYTFDVNEITTQAGETNSVLTGEIEGEEVNHFITITMPQLSSPSYQAIVDSIIFNPSEEELSVTQIIR